MIIAFAFEIRHFVRVVFITDVPDYLFEYIFDGQETGYSPYSSTTIAMWL